MNNKLPRGMGLHKMRRFRHFQLVREQKGFIWGNLMVALASESESLLMLGVLLQRESTARASCIYLSCVTYEGYTMKFTTIHFGERTNHSQLSPTTLCKYTSCDE